MIAKHDNSLSHQIEKEKNLIVFYFSSSGRVNVTCPFCEMYLQTNSIYECRRHLKTHIKELDDFLKSPQVGITILGVDH